MLKFIVLIHQQTHLPSEDISFDLIQNIHFMLVDNLKMVDGGSAATLNVPPTDLSKEIEKRDIFGTYLVFIFVRFLLFLSHLSLVVSFNRHSNSKEAALCD